MNENTNMNETILDELTELSMKIDDLRQLADIELESGEPLSELAKYILTNLAED